MAVLGGLAGCSATDLNSGTGAPPLPAIQHDVGPAAYRAVVRESLEMLNEYWNEQAGRSGETIEPPKALVSYWTRRQDRGCGGYPTGWQNAQYCSISKTISWDGNWLYGVLYRRLGEAAVAFLLAHEYGHLVQDQLGIQNRFRETIEAELNADCLAGAWFGAVNDRVARLDHADYESLHDGMLEVGDPYGVPWNDPTAHGTAAQRGRALLFGARRGPDACLNQLGPGFTS